jgi:AcrR family transcriptional regulator
MRIGTDRDAKRAESGRDAGEENQARLDPRVERTRRLLQDALLQLARERTLDEISIADVADHATVNRATFYQHYPDKETLLADALDAQAARNGADLGNIRVAVGDWGSPPIPLLRYVEHVAENAQLYRSALGAHGSPVATARLRERITQLALDGFRMYGPPAAALGMPPEIAAASVSGSIMGVLWAWLDRDPLDPPEKATGWLWRALTASRPPVRDLRRPNEPRS